MHFPILTSLVALPVAGAILLLFVNGDEERSAPLARNIALVVSLLVFAITTDPAMDKNTIVDQVRNEVDKLSGVGTVTVTGAAMSPSYDF